MEPGLHMVGTINHTEGGAVVCIICGHEAIEHINYKPTNQPKLGRLCTVVGCICTNFWGRVFNL